MRTPSAPNASERMRPLAEWFTLLLPKDAREGPTSAIVIDGIAFTASRDVYGDLGENLRIVVMKGMYDEAAKGGLAHQGQPLALQHAVQRHIVVAAVPDVEEPGRAGGRLLERDGSHVERVDTPGK